jgi:hypothetical protein
VETVHRGAGIRGGAHCEGSGVSEPMMT